MNPNPKLEAALEAVRRGWWIIPVYTTDGKNCSCGNDRCVSQGKHPHSKLVPRGLTQASKDEDQVRAWWAQVPDANIGVVMQPSGLVAFDVDVYKKDDEKLVELIEELGNLPATPEQISGSREGVHILFHHPGVQIRGSINKITLRSKAYIVIAPSEHKSGKKYEWEPEAHPNQIKVAHLPAKWVQALTKDVELDGDLQGVPSPENEADWLKKIPPHERLKAMHEHLAKEAGEIMGKSPPGMMFNITRTCVRGFAVRDANAIFEALKSYNARCVPPYDLERLGNIINNVFEKAQEPSWGSSLIEREFRLKYEPITDDGFRESLRIAERKYRNAPERTLEQSKHQALTHILNYKLGEEQIEDAEDVSLLIQVALEEGDPGATNEQVVNTLYAGIKDCNASELIRLVSDFRGKESLTNLHARGKIREGLEVNDKNIPKSWGSNIAAILKDDPDLKGHLRFNELFKTIEIIGGPLKDVRPNDVPIQLKNWLERTWKISVSSNEVGEQLLTMARTHYSYDPVAEYLKGLTWDRIPRLDNWLIHYCTAQTIDVNGKDVTSFIKKVSARWMISAVARALKPGAKVDTVLVLEGEQGKGKSTTLDILGGAWFSDTPLVMGDKDSRMLAAARWICELAELASIVKSDVETQKAFLSAKRDDFRPPYGKVIESFERRCVFAGTVNPSKEDGEVEYLVDDTGDRRWWPVRISTIDQEALRRDRDQLWAEATFRYLSSELNPHLADSSPDCPGERWWFTRDEQHEADEVAKERHPESAWTDAIVRWAERQSRSTSSALGLPPPASVGAWSMEVIAEGALKIEIDQVPRYRKQIASALRDAGFAQKRKMVDGHYARLWSRSRDRAKQVSPNTN